MEFRQHVYSETTQERLFSAFRLLILFAAITFFINSVLGSIVRYYEAGGACLDWPTCLGQWLLPNSNGSVTVIWDYTHRLFTALSASLSILALILAKLIASKNAWIVRPLYLVFFLLTGQVLIGALLNIGWIESWRFLTSAIHLALSLVIQAAIVLAAIVAYSVRSANSKLSLFFRTPYAKFSLVTTFAVFILLVSGLLVSRLSANMQCIGWPICIPQNDASWIAFSHRIWVGITALMVTGLFIRSWQTQRSQATVLVAATAAFTLFWAQALLGSQMIGVPPTYLLVLHQATAAAVWIALSALVAAAGLAARDHASEKHEAEVFTLRRGMLGDLFSLTKPVVVALLLVTTYAGMVIGARAWPAAGLVFWTLLGGFMAAGGSGAINQFIDRKDDVRMQRTQKRPIPSGRLMPAEGLAFGVAMVLASFYVLVAFVNILAALLSLVGMIYYVLIYSIWLKKITVHNIVIGGGAGAIPPLVGWAAATGSLNIPALFLFAVVFMWTPPHFWALALVRRNDYARAGVPMLPVIRGEKETRWQIFIYTIELVVLTMLLPIFSLGGSIYLAGAAILGLWLIGTAWRVWKHGGNKIAWKMYRHSSMYLAFLFFVLMMDAIIIVR